MPEDNNDSNNDNELVSALESIGLKLLKARKEGAKDLAKTTQWTLKAHVIESLKVRCPYCGLVIDTHYGLLLNPKGTRIVRAWDARTGKGISGRLHPHTDPYPGASLCFGNHPIWDMRNINKGRPAPDYRTGREILESGIYPGGAYCNVPEWFRSRHKHQCYGMAFPPCFKCQRYPLNEEDGKEFREYHHYKICAGCSDAWLRKCLVCSTNILLTIPNTAPVRVTEGRDSEGLRKTSEGHLCSRCSGLYTRCTQCAGLRPTGTLTYVPGIGYHCNDDWGCIPVLSKLEDEHSKAPSWVTKEFWTETLTVLYVTTESCWMGGNCAYCRINVNEFLEILRQSSNEEEALQKIRATRELPEDEDSDGPDYDEVDEDDEIDQEEDYDDYEDEDDSDPDSESEDIPF